VRVLDLFSGIGGFSLGMERAGMETVAFCEIDPFCQKVLKKHWPDVPCYSDITKLTAEQLENDGITGISVLTGGYPCQPFSHAGKREGAEDDRHLWPEMYRLIETIRPRWVVAENVAGHISMGLDQVLSDLEAIGYEWWTFVIPACAKDAWHRRDRVWIVANAGLSESQGRDAGTRIHNRGGRKRQQERGESASCGSKLMDTKQLGSNAHKERLPISKHEPKHKESEGRARQRSCAAGRGSKTGQDDTNTDQQGLEGSATRRQVQGRKATARYCGQGCSEHGWLWPAEPNVGRVVDGVSAGLDRAKRLKSLGNAVVPQVVEQIGRAIMEQAA